jgi:hypothetical protein
VLLVPKANKASKGYKAIRVTPDYRAKLDRKVSKALRATPVLPVSRANKASKVL